MAEGRQYFDIGPPCSSSRRDHGLESSCQIAGAKSHDARDISGHHQLSADDLQDSALLDENLPLSARIQPDDDCRNILPAPISPYRGIITIENGTTRLHIP